MAREEKKERYCTVKQRFMWTIVECENINSTGESAIMEAEEELKKKEKA